MKCAWEIKFNELHMHTTELLMWLNHNTDNSLMRRKHDKFVEVKNRQIDELISSLPKESEHGDFGVN